MALEDMCNKGEWTSSVSLGIRVVVSIDLVKKTLDQLLELWRHLELGVLFHLLQHPEPILAEDWGRVPWLDERHVKRDSGVDVGVLRGREKLPFGFAVPLFRGN